MYNLIGENKNILIIGRYSRDKPSTGRRDIYLIKMFLTIT